MIKKSQCDPDPVERLFSGVVFSKCLVLVCQRDVSSSTFSMRWQSMWSQSRDCGNVDVSQAVRHVHSIVPRSIVVFSTGVEVSDAWFAVEGIRRALKIKLSTWSEQTLQRAPCVENSNLRKIADTW